MHQTHCCLSPKHFRCTGNEALIADSNSRHYVYFASLEWNIDQNVIIALKRKRLMTSNRRELNLRLLGFEASARPLWCQLEILNRQFFPQRCCINAKVPSGRILVLNRRSKRIISIRHQLINLICHCHFSRAATKSVFWQKKRCCFIAR